MSGVALAPPALIGGQPAVGTATLSEPAPHGGAVLTLISADPLVAAVPPTVTVTGDATTANFPVQTAWVLDAVAVPITATYAGARGTVALDVFRRRGPNLGLPARP